MWYAEEIHVRLNTRGSIRQTLAENTSVEASRIDDMADRAASDPEKVESLKRTLRDSVPLSRRWEGTENDIVQQRNLAATPDYGRIRAPVLALYGEADPMVPPAHGRYLADNLNDVEIHIETEGGHAPFLQDHWSFLKARTVAFLRDNAP